VICAVLIIAPQSLSWQLLTDDLQGDFATRLTARRQSAILIY
jgi:hypothetical protein